MEQERSQLSRLDAKEGQAAERLQEAMKLDAGRPEMMAERALVRYQLDQDARLRGEHLAVDLPGPVVEHLGPKPASAASASLWLDAAGRLAQHRAAFEQPDATLLGRQPRLIGDDAYAASHRAAVEAMERFDRALGRQLEIEPPHRALGMSL